MQRLFILITTIFLVGTTCYSQPFKARDAVQAILTQAANDTITNAKIINIATIGDTTGLGSLIPSTLSALININFNESNGNNALWIYTVVGKKGTDTAHSATYIAIRPFVQFLIFPFALPDLGGIDNPFTLSALSSNFLNSDSLVKKITRNPVFKQYRAKHPASKFTIAAIGMNDTARRLGTLEIPVGPLWTAFIGTGGIFADDSLNPPLNCLVPAGIPNAEALCFADEPTSVDEELTGNSDIRLYPNPASDNLTISVAPELYSPQAKIEVYSLLGNQILSYNETMLAQGVGLVIPTATLPNGNYFVSYRGANGIKRLLPFAVSR